MWAQIPAVTCQLGDLLCLEIAGSRAANAGNCTAAQVHACAVHQPFSIVESAPTGMFVLRAVNT